MTSISIRFFGQGSIFSFVWANYVFRKTGHGHAEVEFKQHDLAQDKLHRTKFKWNEDRMTRLHFTNQRLRQKIEAKAYINNVDETMLEYHWVFAKRIKLILTIN